MAKTIRKDGNQVDNSTAELLGWSDGWREGIGLPTTTAAKASPITWGGAGHRLTLGMTGSGKAINAAIPELLSFSGNALAFDSKAELYYVTHRWRRDVLGHQIVLIDPFDVVDGHPTKDGFNPLDLAQLVCGGSYNAAAMLATMFCGITQKSRTSINSSNDDFWQEQATAVLTGLIGSALENKLGLTPSFPSIRALVKSDDPIYNMAVGMDKSPPSKLFREEVASLLQTVEVTRSGIMSTLLSHFRGMSGEGMNKALERSTFDLPKFVSGELRATIYVVIPPEQIQSASRFTRLVFGAILSALYTRRYIPKLKTLVQIDEAATLGTFDPIRTGITLFRGSGVILHTLFQDIDQLITTYADARTLVNNTSLIRLLGSSSYWQATALSELFGFSPQRLMALNADEQMLVLNGQPNICRRVNYLTDDLYRGRFDPNPRYAEFADNSRQSSQIHSPLLQSVR